MNREQKQAHLTLHGWYPVNMFGQDRPHASLGIRHDEQEGAYHNNVTGRVHPIPQAFILFDRIEWAEIDSLVFAALCSDLAEHFP